MQPLFEPFASDIPVETERHSCRDGAYLEKLTKSNATCGWRLVATEPKPPPGLMAVFQRPVPDLDEVYLQILESGLNSPSVSSVEEERIRFLQRCGFVNNELALTRSGQLCFLEAASLDYQCELLELDLAAVASTKGQRVEIGALRHYQGMGYDGCFSEGGIILILLKALCLSWLRETRPSWDTRGWLTKEELRQNASRAFFEAQLSSNFDKRDCFVSEINACSRDSLIANFHEIYSYEDVRNWFPGLNETAILGAHTALGIEKLVRILDLLMENPYRYRKGWPDLTIFRGDEIRLVEVKKDDRLHLSQLVTIPAVRQATQIPVSVLKVGRLAKTRVSQMELTL